MLLFVPGQGDSRKPMPHGLVVEKLALLHLGRRAEAVARRRAERRNLPQSDQSGRRSLAGARPNILKLILTFAVPYAVATYGAVAYRRRASSEHNTEDRR